MPISPSSRSKQWVIGTLATMRCAVDQLGIDDLMIAVFNEVDTCRNALTFIDQTHVFRADAERRHRVFATPSTLAAAER